MTHEAAANQAIKQGADEATLRRVRDRAEVEELLIRYTMSVDLRDWELFRSCFAERVRVRFDPPVTEAPDEPITPDEWAALAGLYLASHEAKQHYYSIYSIRLDQDKAEALMYYRAGRSDHVDGPPVVHRVYTTYRCHHTREGWKIAEISTHALGNPAERWHDMPAVPASEVRPRQGTGKGSKRQAAGTKRSQRSAAKRR